MVFVLYATHKIHYPKILLQNANEEQFKRLGHTVISKNNFK